MKSTIAIALALIIVSTSQAGTNSPVSAMDGVITNSVRSTHDITFNEFLKEVATANLDYAAQRYNVSIAQAAVSAAKEFQNPALQLNGGRDVTHSGNQRMPSTYGASLTQTIELGGKRKYRILGAQQNYAAAAATLDDFPRNLKARIADALSRRRASKHSTPIDLET